MEQDLRKEEGPKFGKRHGQILIYTILLLIAFCMRVDLSVCIVAMTDRNASSNKDIPTYNWTDKSLALSSFLWGYMWPQIGAGWLGSRYGPKWLLIGAMTTCSIFGLLLPTFAKTFGSVGVMVCRVMQGSCQSFVYPSVQCLLGKWAPSNERSRLGSFVHAGAPSGIMVGTLVSGAVASGWYGWPMVFYIFYSAGLIWCLVFAYIGCNSPADHSSITKEEREYIESSLHQRDHSKSLRTPWGGILTSIPFWALVFNQCGYNWGFWTLLTETPNYMSSVMGFSLQNNTALSSLPYIAQCILAVFFSNISDYIINKKLCSLSMTRKIMSSIGLVIPGIALIVLGECGADDVNMTVAALVVAGGINSACFSGFAVNHMDLSPNHSGTLMGICNQAAMICSACGPMLVQWVVSDEKDPRQWRIIFDFAAGVYFLTTIVFSVFGSGEVQPWNDEVSEDQKVQPGKYSIATDEL